jgi:hypothetical protein
MTIKVPFLLAGPIVRRARPDQVFIWIAVSKECWLGAEAYRTTKQGEGFEIDTSVPIGEGTSGKRIQLGGGLWIHIIELLPNANAKGSFPAREIIAYDVIARNNPLTPIRGGSSGNFSGSAGVPSKLGQSSRKVILRPLPKLAVSPKRAAAVGRKIPVMSTRIASTGQHLKDMEGVHIEDFCLKGFTLPTFILQEPGKNDLTAYFGSCRKLHGAGDDGARMLEHRLNSVATSLRNRPTSLFLTGDQIYADDISDDLFVHVIELGEATVGPSEPLPDVASLPRKPQQRAKIALDTAKFTSTAATNHAFTCGEFAALYLLAWNPDLWPSGKLTERLNEGREGSRCMRRVLANVATYMAFDDHEVTDDWNLNEDWEKAARKSALGTRVMANGLAAFLVFQGWGNQPERFDDALMDLIEDRVGDPGVDGPNDKAWDDRLLGFHLWAFTTPTTPTTLFLNPRTRRGTCNSDVDYRRLLSVNVGPLELPGKQALFRLNKPPLLMNSDETDRAKKLVGDVRGKPLILVAQAPVFSIEGIDALASASNQVAGAAAKDFESWRANPEAFLRLFTDLVGPLAPDRCAILSGDVHFSHVTQGHVDVGGNRIRIGQYTSSSLKNNIIDGTRGVGALFTIVRASRKEVKRRLWWWAARDNATTHFEGDLGDDDLAEFEEELIKELGKPDIIEDFVHEDMGIQGQGIMVEHNNMGVLHAKTDIEVTIFGIGAGNHFASTTFKI